jgi:hypothetical protein
MWRPTVVKWKILALQKIMTTYVWSKLYRPLTLLLNTSDVEVGGKCDVDDGGGSETKFLVIQRFSVWPWYPVDLVVTIWAVGICCVLSYFEGCYCYPCWQSWGLKPRKTVVSTTTIIATTITTTTLLTTTRAPLVWSKVAPAKESDRSASTDSCIGATITDATLRVASMVDGGQSCRLRKMLCAR